MVVQGLWESILQYAVKTAYHLPMHITYLNYMETEDPIALFSSLT